MKKQSILSVLLAFAMVLNVCCLGPIATALQAKTTAASGNEVIGSNVLTDVDFTEATLSELDGAFVASSGDSSAETLTAAKNVSAVWNGGKATAQASVAAEPTNVALGGSTALTDAQHEPNVSTGYDASRMSDGVIDYTKYTSTKAQTSPNTTFIAKVNMNGGAYVLSSVKVYWRNEAYCYAKDFTIEVFHNNEWVEVAKETDYTYAATYEATFEPMLATSVRLVATELTADNAGKYRLQLVEFEAYGVKKTLLSKDAKASLTSQLNTTTNAASVMVDDKYDQFASTKATSSATDSQTAKLIFADGCSYVSDIVFHWRDYRGRPSAFHVDVFNAETDKWETVATETEYYGWNSTKSPYTYSVSFDTPVLSNQVRLVSDVLTPEGTTYYLQLKEIEVFGTADTSRITDATATVGKTTWDSSGFPASNLLDGTYNNASKNSGFAVAKGDATVTFADSAAHKVNKVILYPRVDKTTANQMPAAFTLEAYDGKQWVTVAEKSGVSTEGPIAVAFEPIVCSKIKLTVTEISGGTDFHVTELEVFGEKVGFLKPTTAKADGQKTFLTVKDKQFTNFHAEIEMLRTNDSKANYGLVFGQTAPNSNSGVQSVRSRLTLGGIMVSASMQPLSAKYVEADAQDYVETKYAAGMQFNYGDDYKAYAYDKGNVLGYPTTPDDITTNILNVEVVDGIAKVWWTGFEKTAWTVELDGYQGGYVSLFSNGNDQGGFKSFKITELLVRNAASVDFTEATLSELDGAFAASSGDSSAETLTAAENVSAVWNGGKATAQAGVAAEPTNVALGGSGVLTNASNTSIVLSSCPASRLVDGVPTTDTFASTTAQTSADTTVIARVNLNGGAYELSSVKIYWRGGTRGYAKDFTVEVFHNNEWVEVKRETGYTYASTYEATFEPVLATAVRLVATKLTTDQSGGETGTSYYLQIKEIEAYGVKKTLLSTGAKASLTNILSGNSASSLVDGNFSAFISGKASGANDSQTAKLTFADGCSYVSDIVFYWRDSRGRPSAFHIDVFNAETDQWETVKTVTGYTPPAPYNYSLSLETPILSNQVRLVSDVLTPENAAYYLQLKEIEVFGTADTSRITDATATADTPSWAQSSFPASKLLDGTYNNQDSNHDFTVATSNATVTFADSAAHKVNKVVLYPRVDTTTANQMPAAFTLEAYDGKQWVTVAEKSGVSTEGPIVVAFEPIVCSKIELTVTEISGDPQFHLTELEVFGEKVGFLKPTAAKANGQKTFLTVKNKQFTNFHAEIEMLRTDDSIATYGLVFGQTAPTSNSGIQSVRSRLKLGGIFVSASMKSFSAKYVEADAQDYVVDKYAAGQQFNYGTDGKVYAYDKGYVLDYPTTPDNITTNILNVEVVDGVAKVWWTGFEKTAWTVELDGYQGGYVSLYSNGNDQGGFKSFRITELAASDITVTTGVTIHAAGDYTVVELTDNMAKGILKTNTVTGALNFDSAKFEYRAAVFADASAEQNEGAAPAADAGKLGFTVKACNADVVVKLFFKNLTDEYDYTGFALEIESITKENGDALAVEIAPETVAGDLTGDVKDTADKKLDIRDLVNADANDKDTAIVQSGLLGTNDYAAEAEAVAGQKKN